jgi:HTH-type transcriptional regulator, global nitrogen regulator NrpRI
MNSRNVHAKLLILKALHELGDSAGATKIAKVLSGMGLHLQPRTVRFHLLQMDREGLTRCTMRRSGRQLTDLGKRELDQADVFAKVGFVSARVDELGYRMTMNLQAEMGTVIPNVAIISQKDFSRAIHFMTPIFESGLSIGERIAYKMQGEHIGSIMVPRGKVALATICSMTINSLFLKSGIPVTSRFGGLLMMGNRIPVRFVDMINYTGTSIDPLKLFTLAKMTRISPYPKSGSGIIGASFREFPSVAYDQVLEVITTMKTKYNLDGILALGRPNMPLLDIPVSEGRTAMAVLGGLNPIAVLHEMGVPVEINPLYGLEELSTFVPFADAAPIGRHGIPYTY